MLWTAIFLPFEIAFIDAPTFPDASDGLFVLNRVLDVIFIGDLFLTFFVAVSKRPEDDDLDPDDEVSADELAALDEVTDVTPFGRASGKDVYQVTIELADVVSDAFAPET